MISNLTKAIVIMLFMTGTAFGAHPLITDDTGTNGKGKFQLELNGEFARDKEKSEVPSKREASKQQRLSQQGSWTLWT